MVSLFVEHRGSRAITNLRFCNGADRWNPAVEEQAIDRVHRIGQKRDVHIYRFKMKNTFETFVYQVSDRKKNLIAGTIGGEGGTMSANQPRLTMADFKTLFRGAAENLIQKGATGAALSAARGILEI